MGGEVVVDARDPELELAREAGSDFVLEVWKGPHRLVERRRGALFRGGLGTRPDGSTQHGRYGGSGSVGAPDDAYARAGDSDRAVSSSRLSTHPSIQLVSRPLLTSLSPHIVR